MWLLLLTAPIISFIVLKVLFKESKNETDRAPKVSCFKGIPLLGNAHQMVKLSWPIKDLSPNTHVLQALNGMAVVFKKERIFKVALGPDLYYVIFEAKYIEELIKDNKLIDKPDAQFKALRPWFGNGLITGNGLKWRTRRKMLVPAFHFKILDQFQEIMNDKSRIMVEKLGSLVGKDFDEKLDVNRVIELCNLDVICETAMGYTINALENPNIDFIKHLHNLCERAVQRVVSPVLAQDIIWSVSPQGRSFNKSNNFVQTFIKKVISERKQTFLDNNGNIGERPVFLDIMLQQHLENPSFTEQDMLEEVNTFMFAGQDTTAVAMSWLLFMLGHHPEIQDKVAQELFDVLGENSDGDITIDNLKQLKYLECVIKEGQRLFPSVPVIARNLTEDFPLGDSKVLPKGSLVIIMLGFLSMDEDTFPEPLNFDPERFTAENSKGRNPFASIPFSAGVRNCIGQRFAMLNLKTMLAHIIRTYRVTSLDQRDEVPISLELVARPSRKLKFLLQLRGDK